MFRNLKLTVIIVVGLIFIIIIGAVTDRNYQINSSSNNFKNMMSKTLKLTSTAFEPSGLIPEKYTCDGQNFNPPLAISGVSPQTKSLALIMHDPDAPAIGGWDHWLVYNLPPDTIQLGEGEPPAGTLGLGSSGNANYEGPCPPSGTHRYSFKLYALDVELALSLGAKKSELEEAMEGHILDQTELIGRYGRK